MPMINNLYFLFLLQSGITNLFLQNIFLVTKKGIHLKKKLKRHLLIKSAWVISVSQAIMQLQLFPYSYQILARKTKL